MEKDLAGNDFVANAAFRNSSCLITVLNWFKKHFQEDLQEVFYKKLRTLAHIVAEFCSEGLTKNFFKFCLSSFDLMELKNMIMMPRNGFFDALELSLRNPSNAVASVVWNVYVKTHSEKELEELLFENQQGRHYFTIDDKEKNPEAVKKLKTIVTARYGEARMLKLIRQPALVASSQVINKFRIPIEYM